MLQNYFQLIYLKGSQDLDSISYNWYFIFLKIILLCVQEDLVKGKIIYKWNFAFSWVSNIVINDILHMTTTSLPACWNSNDLSKVTYIKRRTMPIKRSGRKQTKCHIHHFFPSYLIHHKLKSSHLLHKQVCATLFLPSHYTTL